MEQEQSVQQKPRRVISNTATDNLQLLHPPTTAPIQAPENPTISDAQNGAQPRRILPPIDTSDPRSWTIHPDNAAAMEAMRKEMESELAASRVNQPKQPPKFHGFDKLPTELKLEIYGYGFQWNNEFNVTLLPRPSTPEDHAQFVLGIDDTFNHAYLSRHSPIGFHCILPLPSPTTYTARTESLRFMIPSWLFPVKKTSTLILGAPRKKIDSSESHGLIGTWDELLAAIKPARIVDYR